MMAPLLQEPSELSCSPARAFKSTHTPTFPFMLLCNCIPFSSVREKR
jgi:hypothetical protein